MFDCAIVRLCVAENQPREGAGYDPTRPMKGWRTAWRALTQAAGVPGFRFHDLRHTFITNHAEMGTPLSVVQAQAGHLSRRMTELYTHISQRALQKAAEKYEQRKGAALERARKNLEAVQNVKPAKRAAN